MTDSMIEGATKPKCVRPECKNVCAHIGAFGQCLNTYLPPPDQTDAEKIAHLRGLLRQARNYIDRDHHGMLAEIDAALNEKAET